MGPELLGELDKPKKHSWVEEQIEAGTFGPDNAGIETVAAGGMHSVFAAEKGTVWTRGVNDDAALGRVTEGVPDQHRFALRGVIYAGENHFTSRIIKENGAIWHHALE
ncbi:hypothetical protein B0H14DRAFT_2594787 [Mycena olivaceomarginata]|nr:hypothetical protein B0H14DRAFT_2594787 [Mycena olivaceomarginata]